ncbi:MAG: tetratricopeptide repeat protein [Kofleriaceae bacterium]|nr:tetratricopeptide repeat protein [Kofleriaceae bacterium]
MNAIGKTLSRGLFFGALLSIGFGGSQGFAQPAAGQPGGPVAGQPGGPAAGQPGGPAAGQPVAPRMGPGSNFGPTVLTPEELEILAEVEQDLIRYEKAANLHHKRVRIILASEYKDRKGQLESRYAEKIGNAEKQELARRLSAIVLLEKFVQDYPNHQKFTPDAMFRLADLYLEQAEYDFNVSFDEDLDFGDDDDDDTFLASADYSKSIGMWDKIVRNFPKYRQKANTLYLLAYYLKQTEQERPALQIFRGLVCSNKYDALAEPEPAPDMALARAALGTAIPDDKSGIYEGCIALSDNKELLQDAWVRGIGDIHFLTPGELGEAIGAYERVAGDEQSKFYDEALYKLAWSYYRNDDFLLSIEAFDKSVVYSDKQVAEGKEELELRDEAIQYIAISFTDPWSVDEDPDPSRSWDRAMDFYKDRFDEPHVRDVFIQLGDTFSVLESYSQASDAWRLALTKWPLHPENPEIHQNIVNAFVELGDTDLANEEAGRLAARYAPGTEWYTANETNRIAMENQRRIGERMLKAAAENTHKSAQAARQDWLADSTEENKAIYIDLYLKAGALYERFLKENPTAESSYEFTYRLGEVLFFAEHYQEAIPHYVWVRDHRDLSETRFEKAARSVVQSYQKELEKQIADNTVVEPSIPTIDELLAMPKPIAGKPLPQAYVDLQDSLDKYQTMVNDPETAPNMGYEAALISFRHLNLADAENRFQATLDRFCGSDQSVKSKDALLAIYEALGDDEKFKATNEAFISSKCGSDDDVALAQAQNRSKEFREAAALFKEQKFADAAIAFYVFYKTAPPDDPNRPIALYNGAIAYDKSGKPKTAVYLLKEFTENTNSAFRDSEYFLPALYLTAVSYYKAFDYDNAVKVYLDVVKAAADKSRKPPAGERTAPEMRLDALYNAANIRELDRVYKDPRSAPGTGAASLFERYASLETDGRKADRALFAVARVWKGAKNLRLQERAYATWRGKYGNLAINSNDYVFSYYDMAKQYEKSGNSRATAKAKKATLSAWIKVGSPKDAIASDLAAEFAFQEADKYYDRTFTPFKIKRSPKTEKEAKKVFADLIRLADNAQKKFTDMNRFESGPWSLASLVRVGDIRFFQALKIAEIPIPKEIIRLDNLYPSKDILIQYEDTIASLVKPLEEQAKIQWEKVVNAGKAQRLSNEWTQLAQERLHDFVSQDEFPVLRTELREGTETP